MFRDTTATRKIFGLKKRIRAVSGGTGASKTISILVWLIDYAQSTKNKRIDVVSESHPHLEDGAINDFKAIMSDRGYWADSQWNDTKHVYTFESGSMIKFKSFDKYGKAHGPRRDVLFVNECNNIPYNIVDQLITRTREIVWLDWNPTIEFWFYTEMQPNRDDIDFLRLTYLDNEALDQNTIKEIESHKHNKYWWQVYGLGELGELEGKVYSNWLIVDSIPHEAKLEAYGLDFGYTNDPSAIVAVWWYNGGYILDEVLFRQQMSNREIANVLNSLEKALVVADSAEPKSIDEIKSYGIMIVPAEKGQDSVRQGIQFVQDQKISVTKRSVNLLKEYRNYMWKTDRDGSRIQEPEHAYSHSMDAIRYALSTKNTSMRAIEEATKYVQTHPLFDQYGNPI